MLTFTTDDVLTNACPTGVPPALWERVRDHVEEHVHELFVTYRFAADPGDLADPAAIEASPLLPLRWLMEDGTACWAVPLDEGDYALDVLLVPCAPWVPADVRETIEARLQGGDDA